MEPEEVPELREEEEEVFISMSPDLLFIPIYLGTNDDQSLPILYSALSRSNFLYDQLGDFVVNNPEVLADEVPTVLYNHTSLGDPLPTNLDSLALTLVVHYLNNHNNQAAPLDDLEEGKRVRAFEEAERKSLEFIERSKLTNDPAERDQLLNEAKAVYYDIGDKYKHQSLSPKLFDERQYVKDFDQMFLKMIMDNYGIEQLYALLEAANALDISSLLDLGTTHIANMIKGKTAEEMRVVLKIKAEATTT